MCIFLKEAQREMQLGTPKIYNRFGKTNQNNPYYIIYESFYIGQDFTRIGNLGGYS